MKVHPTPPLAPSITPTTTTKTKKKKKNKKTKKNASTVKAATQTAAAAAKADVYRALLAAPAPSSRPSMSDKVSYHGGRRYYSEKKSAFRVYRRSADRVETTVTVNSKDPLDKIYKFQVACALIEQDPRPV